MQEILVCPICKTALEAKSNWKEWVGAIIDCPNCGRYNLPDEFYSDFIASNHLEPIELATLSYAIRRMQGHKVVPVIVSDLATSILQNTTLPTATEQIDNLVLYLGKILTEPGSTTTLQPDSMRATLGSITLVAAQWVIQEAIGLGLVQANVIPITGNPVLRIELATLSITGWQRYSELQNAVLRSRRAFMAMKFRDPQMDHVFSHCFKKAVKNAGFDLMTLEDEPRAGLIDDRLRLDIRTSRFLIADLSHANKGAYWEAGFAEGLGKHVIYTCRKDIMDHHDKEMRPHFDTNHHLIVPWNPDDLEEAANNLTTTIRATLPSEAKLTDE